MAQSQDGRDTVQEWVHKQKKETKKEKKRKENQRWFGFQSAVSHVPLTETYTLLERPLHLKWP